MAIGICLASVLLFAWFSKPVSLRTKINGAGIHLEPGTERGSYAISASDRVKLETILQDSGYKFRRVASFDVVVDVYELDNRFFYFWHRKQRVDVYIDAQKLVTFEPDI